MAASLQVKKGRLYAVIQHKGSDGKYKSVWRALGLPEDANKAKVNKAYREVVSKYEIEAAEEAERMNRPQNEIPIFEYMTIWLEKQALDCISVCMRLTKSFLYGLAAVHLSPHRCIFIFQRMVLTTALTSAKAVWKSL